MTRPAPRVRWSRSAFRWHAHQVADIVATVATVAVAEVALRTTGLRRAARILGVHLGGDEETIEEVPDAPLPVWAHRRLRTVDRVIVRWPFGDTCLRRALVGAQRLRRLDPLVIVGVRMADDVLEAHAWLRVAGWDLDVDAGAYHVIDADPRV